MKKPLLLILVALLGGLPPAVQAMDKPDISATTAPAHPLRTFDLNFPGGTPQELVNAIEKSSGHPLNAIIPDMFAEYRLPPLRMSRVTVMDLFQALQQAVVPVAWNSGYGQSVATFRTVGSPSVSGDDLVWTFTVTGTQPPPNVVRFYLLAPYLNRGLTVDDITTAIQTAWRMAGGGPAPQLSFHKETQLLIAAGDPAKIESINAVLHALEPMTAQAKTLPPSSARLDDKKQ